MSETLSRWDRVTLRRQGGSTGDREDALADRDGARRCAVCRERLHVRQGSHGEDRIGVELCSRCFDLDVKVRRKRAFEARPILALALFERARRGSDGLRRRGRGGPPC